MMNVKIQYTSPGYINCSSPKRERGRRLFPWKAENISKKTLWKCLHFEL